MESLPLPAYLASALAHSDRGVWVAGLSAKVANLAERWELTLGTPFEPGGRTAWVAPARGKDGSEFVLKIGWRHPEAEAEGLALAAWAGQGAIKLYRQKLLGDSRAFLLERCKPGLPLIRLPGNEQDLILAGLLRRLWIVPPVESGFASLASMCQAWATRFEADRQAARFQIDAGLAQAALELFLLLPKTATRQVLLCTDLHAENILSAEREPWLAIDPKPFVGDPTYDVLQHLLNCGERLHRDPKALVARLAGLLDLDRERLQQWLFARCVYQSVYWEKDGLDQVARALLL